MPDPRLSLTAKDLAYAATGVRLLARQAESQAKDPTFESCRRLFEDSVRTYDELAGKLDRMAEMASRIPVPVPSRTTR
jgi:hypothetical protein